MASANSITLINQDESLLLSFIISFRRDYIGDKLLSYIAAGRDGNQALLNLRKVCSTTKSWIDELSPAQNRRFSPKLQVCVFLCRKNIADFLLSQPPFKVTSLKLENTDYICSHTRNGHSVEERKLTRSFLAFWLPKIESLEIERVTDTLINIFGSSTSLKRIRCDNSIESFSNLVGLESLSVIYTDNYGNGASLFVQMAAQNNLKKLETRGHTEDLKGLTTLINAKRFDKQFQLRTALVFERCRQDLNLDALKDFVYAVANSSSSICLTGLNDFALSKIVEVTQDEKTLHNFFMTVRWIQFLYFKDLEFIVDLLKRNKFPNLERFDEYQTYAPPEQVSEEFPELFQLPAKLQFLTIGTKTFLKEVLLPQSLKYLRFSVRHLTVVELQDAICTISESCPFLEEFSVSWDCTLPITINDISSRLENKEIFPNLQHLSVSAVFTFEDTLNSSQVLLFNIFKLNTLKVKNFELHAHCGIGNNNYPMVLGSEVLDLLLKSPVAESILCYYFGVFFKSDHKENLEVLTTLVERNSVIHQQRYGRKKISSCPDYLSNKY